MTFLTDVLTVLGLASRAVIRGGLKGASPCRIFWALYLFLFWLLLQRVPKDKWLISAPRDKSRPRPWLQGAPGAICDQLAPLIAGGSSGQWVISGRPLWQGAPGGNGRSVGAPGSRGLQGAMRDQWAPWLQGAPGGNGWSVGAPH